MSFPSGQHPAPNCQETPWSSHLSPGCRHLAPGSNSALSPGPAHLSFWLRYSTGVPTAPRAQPSPRRAPGPPCEPSSSAAVVAAGAQLGFRPAPGAGVTPPPGRGRAGPSWSAPRPAAAAADAIRGRRSRRALRGARSAMVSRRGAARCWMGPFWRAGWPRPSG